MASYIKVRLENNNWVDANMYQKIAFEHFKFPDNQEMEYFYNNMGYVFSIKRINGAIYLIRENGTKMPIIDWNDVKVFLLDVIPVNWYSARNYQTWAYIDFIYSNCDEKYYCSKYSTNISIDKNYNIIPIDNLPSNIIFKMSRNKQGRVFYEKDDVCLTKVIITDNEMERKSYMGFYDRMTMSLFEQKSNFVSTSLSSVNITFPEVNNISTSINEFMCIVCNNIKKNIIYRPCNHNMICKDCSLKIIKKKNKLTCPICQTNVFKVDKLLPINWFDFAFGFVEQDYQTTKNIFHSMYKEGNMKTLNNIDIGDFSLYNINDFYSLLPFGSTLGNVTFNNIVGDIKNISLNENIHNATIQVASQMNCLEMIHYTKNPEDGITIYSNDNTQGPICVMCTPAGLAYRNYIYNGGQTKHNQINMIENLLNYFKSFDQSIKLIVTNGYLFANDISSLEKISSLLKNNDIRNIARTKIYAGIHNNLGVYANNQHFSHKINHVLCSGIPIAYHNYPYNNTDLWNELSSLILETYYELTLLSACLNNKKNRHNNPCILTQIGGGVFGMNKNHIINAVSKACDEIKRLGYNLDVIMVHYGSIHYSYDKLICQ
jgi:hypothetical protein